MAGRNGSPGDQYVQNYPPGRQSGPYPTQVQAGHGGASQAGHPQAGYPRPGQPQPGYAQPGYAQPGYAQAGYGRPGRSQAYPAQADPRAGYGGSLLGPPQPQLQPSPGPSRPSGRGGRGGGRKRWIDYPRAGRTGILRWIPSWKLTGTTVLTLVVTMILALLTAYAATPIPPIQTITTAQATTVYYGDGRTVLAKLYDPQGGNRTIVAAKDIPDEVKAAVVAAEDKTFYENKGVSPVGIVRALWNNVRGRPMQGGSTITQQYVKNSRVGNARSLQRKIKEFFISIKINNEKPKDDILADYLNTIPFGRNAYGIQAATLAYFDKKSSVKQLTLAEGVYLATIIQRPEYFSNIDMKKPEQVAELTTRFNYVLDTMVEMGKLTPEQRATVKIPKLKVRTAPKRSEDDQTVYLEQMVRDELEALGYKQQDIIRAGYKIYTTFDKKLIDAAVAAVHSKEIGMGPRTSWTAGTEVGLVSIQPRTGAVRAIYGGNGVRAYSAATQDAPQAGSTYKVFTLLAALEGKSKNGSDGISLKSRYDGHSPYYYDKKSVSSGSNKVTNFDGEQYSMINLIKATEHSVNTVYAQLNEEIGNGTGARTRDAATRAGIPKDAIGNEVSNTLGNGTPHVVDMASAYGTIAAGGVHHPYFVIEKIVSPTGTVLYTHDNDKFEKAFSSGVTADATYALQQVVKEGTGSYAKRVGRPVAGKTGTVGTTGRKTKAAWFVGFTPQLSTAVAIHRVGKDGGSEDVIGWGPFKKRDMQGGMFPVRIWTEFMKAALEGKDVEEFPERANVGEIVNPEPEPTATPSPSDDQADDGQGDDGQGDDQTDNGDQGDGRTTTKGTARTAIRATARTTTRETARTAIRATARTTTKQTARTATRATARTTTKQTASRAPHG